MEGVYGESELIVAAGGEDISVHCGRRSSGSQGVVQWIF